MKTRIVLLSLLPLFNWGDWLGIADYFFETERNEVATVAEEVTIACSFADYTALMALYNSTNPGDTTWKNSGGDNGNAWGDPFNAGTCGHCNWHGVACDVMTKRVTSVTFLNNNLVGPLPTELGDLTDLKSLRLPVNKLSGSIPSTLGNLSNLEVLELNTNQLTGNIPTTLGNIDSLSNLQLFNNQLNGLIPIQLSMLTNLTKLALWGNQLTGTIPTALGNISNLERLELHLNQLSGTIPAALGNLTNLTKLSLSTNQLTGNIPVELGNLAQLDELSLNTNQLTGSIPTELGNLSELTILDLGSNQLIGNIPVELANLADLSKLILRNNQLSGGIPSVLGSLADLTELSLEANQLNGSIPVELGNLLNLTNLTLHTNQLTGTIPTQLGSLSNLTVLSLYNNQLMGSIPVELGGLSSLETLRLQNNSLSGPIPTQLGNLDFLRWIDLSSNDSLNGNIPSTLGGLALLENLYLGGNMLTGTIPAELGNLSSLEDLQISSNQLTGDIPKELGNLLSLTQLILSFNELTGAIPKELGNLTSLTTVRLNDNNLSGCYPPELKPKWCNLNTVALSNNNCLPSKGSSIEFNAFCTDPNYTCTEPCVTTCTHPDYLTLEDFYNATNGAMWTNDTLWLSNCDPCGLEEGNSPWFGLTCQNNRVTSIYLHENNLNGQLPNSINDLTELQSLFIKAHPDSVGLIGPIPASLGNLSQITHINLSDNSLLGNIPTTIWDLSTLKNLDLASNSLSGSLPAAIGNLDSLQVLRLHLNYLLGGNLPDEISGLSKLTELSLHDNQFTGKLPDLIHFPDLQYLFLSSNQFSGCIPSSYQSFCPPTSKVINISNNPQLVTDFFTFCNDPVPYTCPPYDECVGAIEVPINGVATLTNENATASRNGDPICFVGPAYNGGDVWFKFTAPASPTDTVELDIGINGFVGDTFRVTHFVIFENGCESSYSPPCIVKNTSNGDTISMFTGDFASDSTYYVVLYDNENDETAQLEVYVNQVDVPCDTTQFPDYAALAALYHSTNGDTWNNKTGWLDCDPCGKQSGGTPWWHGITCNADSTRVIEINLSSNNLNGHIPTIIDSLSHLTRLDLSFNSLSGNIPSEIGNLTNLNYLGLNNTQLNGAIPTELGNLDSLVELHLHTTSLTGNIPAELGNLDSLVYLALSNNIYLSGPIPHELGNLSKLEYLYLFNSGLNGNIPPELGNLSNLILLYLQTNNLEGSIPPELGNLLNLANLSLSSNQLSGCYPPELKPNWCNINNLSLSGNQCLPDNGSATEFNAFCNDANYTCIDPCLVVCEHPDVPALDSLYKHLNGNGWSNNTGWTSGNCDPCGEQANNNAWKGITCENNRVTKLSLGAHNVKGIIPPEIGSLDSLKELRFANDSIGFIPSVIGTLSNLEVLMLYNCMVKGNIPSTLGDLTKLELLDIRYNALQGCLPNNLYNLCPIKEEVKLLGNGGLDETNFLNFCTSCSGVCTPANCPPPSNDCPQTIYVWSSPPIPTDTIYKASDSIISVTTVPSFADSVVFQAGNVVLLQAGFHAQAGAKFVARIGSCEVANLTEQAPQAVVRTRYSSELTVENSLKVFPNPFRNATTIEFDLTAPNQVQLQLLDLTGRVVQIVLPSSHYETGRHRVTLQNEGLRAGIYLLRLRSGQGQVVRKVMVIE
ncbi:MAG: 3-coathanger stack domain-containing protein [Bacteroidota bacterium]